VARPKAGFRRSPTQERLGPDDRKDLQDRRNPAVQLDKEPAIIVRKPDATMEPAPQDIQLMSKHRVLSFKPYLRLEWRGQNETEQPDHSASLGDSIASSTRIRFSVHTRKKLSTVRIAGEEFKIHAPGFKAILRKGEEIARAYWVADEDAINSGYPTKTVPIPVGLGVGNMPPCDVAAVIEEECQKQQSAMLAWLDGDVDDKERLAPKFNGTLSSLADCYESDEDSAYQELKENSAEVYKAWLKMVRETVGLRNVSPIVAKDFRRWYRMWKARSTSRGTDGTRQAYGGIQIIRIILNFGAESGIKKCLELRMAMDKMNFRRNPPRNVVMTFAQIRAVIEEHGGGTNYSWRLCRPSSSNASSGRTT
jgi:hypothetical protein